MPRLLPLRILDHGVRALAGSHDSVSQPFRPIPPPATSTHRSLLPTYACARGTGFDRYAPEV